MPINGCRFDRQGEHPFPTPFWATLAQFADAPAIIEPSMQRSWTYRALAGDVAAGANRLRGTGKSLILLCAHNGAEFVLAYLSALQAGNAVMLVAPARNHGQVVALAETYAPETILSSVAMPPELLTRYQTDGELFGLPRLSRTAEIVAPPPHPELALVLPTSGTSARPKMVRLSVTNIVANAHQIAQGLGLAPSSRAATSLPLSYVFGLSVLNSHLACGGSLVLTAGSIVEPEFWRTVQDHRVTTLAGVSMTFDLLRRIRFDRRCAPALGQMLHAGGRISADMLAWIAAHLSPEIDVRHMYGMTEAAGRMCIPGPGLISSKPGSVGRPVPSASIRISAESEIIFSGPNVMLGYADTRSDLAKGDDLRGVLHTGDVGFADADGDIFITGRTSRVFKLFGRRHSLDDLEERFSDLAIVAAVSQDGTIRIHYSEGDATLLKARISEVARSFGLPAAALKLALTAELPRNPYGKIAYDRLPRDTGGAVGPSGWNIVE